MARCIPCLGSDVKVALKDLLPRKAAKIDAFPECAAPKEIKPGCSRGSKSSGGDGPKRAAGPYAAFVGSCLKKADPTLTQPQKMKSCAVQWKHHKSMQH